MKCYYEVLSVGRDAEESEIKTAYKKLALRYHPDKNLDNTEEAKEQFQLVQQAYEVLSDRQERAWYDNHREQILRGCDKEYEDNALDVFQYFTTSCYRGFGDDDNSFYAVYKGVFEALAKEDLEYMDDKDDFMNIPGFGGSESDYDEVVGPFYAYWMSYSTYKSYVWLDPYDIREAKERRLLKHIEKENKKVRAKAKKERNEEVRNLVAFVRKRDKRVQRNAKRLEERARENKLNVQKLSEQRRMERRREIEEAAASAEWTKFGNVQGELEQIEKSLAEEFGEEISNSEDEEQPAEDLYCMACNKLFKTPKAFQNHESSKKHRENVERLRQELLDEEDEFDSSSSEIEDENTLDQDENTLNQPENVVQDVPEIKSDEEEVDHELSLSESEIKEESDVEVVTKKSKKKAKKVLRIESEDEPADLNEAQHEEEVEVVKKEKKAKRKKKPKEQPPTTKCEDADSDVEAPRRNKKKQPAAKVETVEDVNHCCVSCKSKFESKNKLFQHLKKTGHGIYLPKEVKSTEGKKKGIK